MNKTVLITGLGSFAAGCLLVFLLMRQPTPPPEKPTNAPAAPMEAKAEPKPDKPEKPKEKEAPAEPAKPAIANALDQLPDIRKKMQDGLAESHRLKVEERLAALKTRLNLTPEQTEKVRALLERILADPNQLPLGDMLGTGVVEINSEKLKAHRDAVLADRAKAEAELAALLDATQQTAYEQWKTEDRANRVEARANQELASLQSQLSLTPEQKDKAFALLSKLAADELDDLNPLTGAERFLQRRNARIEGMKEILSEEQMAVYQRQAASGMVNISVNGVGGGGAFFSGDGVSGSVNVIEVHQESSAIPASPGPGEKK